MPGSLTFRHLKKGYTPHVHNVGGGENDTHAVHVKLQVVKSSKVIYLARP
jgi:hypothetical protein